MDKDKYLTGKVQHREITFYLLMESEMSNLKSNTIVGDLLFAAAMIFFGAAFSNKGSTSTWIYLGALTLTLSFYFYWERKRLIRRVTQPRDIPKVKGYTEKTPLNILKAEYGAGSQWIDVTDRLTRALHPGSTLMVTNGLAGSDPLPHVVKWLRVIFEIDGKRFVNEYLEGTAIVLPTSENG